MWVNFFFQYLAMVKIFVVAMIQEGIMMFDRYSPVGKACVLFRRFTFSAGNLPEQIIAFFRFSAEENIDIAKFAAFGQRVEP